MSVLRTMLVGILSLLALVTGAARGSATVDFSDQWWTPTESGWGAAVLQQANTLFVNLMVYGTDGKPTWFVAAAAQAGASTERPVFAGELYASTGPYFGGAFNPAQVAQRRVGTLTFAALTSDAATLAYTVDGTLTTKAVTRQTWAYDNVGGSYMGGWNGDKVNCINSPVNAPPVHFEDALTFTIDHAANNAVRIIVGFADGSSIALNGTYSQSGRMGRIAAEFDQSYPTWSYGYLDMVEIEATPAGITARFTGDLMTGRWRDWCDIANGRIGGVRR